MITLRRPMRPLLFLLVLPLGASLAHAVPVTLRVMDSAQKPVAGAQVQYLETRVPQGDDDEEDYQALIDAEKPKPRSAVTGADGTVTLDLPDVALNEAAKKQMALRAARTKKEVNLAPVLGNAQVSAEGLARESVTLRAGENSVTLPQAAQMSGLVQGDKGAPIEGAQVKLQRVVDADKGDDYFFFDDSSFEPLRAITGEDGRWTLGQLPQKGIASMQVSAQGRVSERFRAWLEGAENAAPTQKLAVGGKVSGRLLDRKGEPVAGAQVYRSNAYGAVNRSDKDGRFTLDGVPIGEQKLQIWSLKARWFPNDEKPLVATVPPGGGAVDLGDLVSGEGTLISGVVVDKTTRKPMPNLEIRLENQKLKTDAAGRFEGRIASEYLQLQVLGDYVASGNDFRQIPAKTKVYDAGQIAVERAASLPLDVRDEKGETVTETAVMISNDRHQEYPKFDGETQKVGPLEAGTYKIKGYGAWEIIEPKTAVVPAFEEGKAPTPLKVTVRKVPPQKIAGRVVDAKGAPLGNVVLAIKLSNDECRFQQLSALSKRDGSWQTEFSPQNPNADDGRNKNAPSEPSVGEVKREGYALLRGGKVERAGDLWSAADLVMARADATLSGRVVSVDGTPVTNASLSWLGAKVGEFARTDGEGNFELTGLPDAPLQLRVSDGPRLLETRELTPGEITDIALPAPLAPADAQTLWQEASAGGIVGLDGYFEALGAPRLLEAARRADAAKVKPEDKDKIGPNLDVYLGMLVRHNPANAAREGVALVENLSLTGADGAGVAVLALAAARSDDAAARAWANRWFDARKDEFSMQQDGDKGVTNALRLAVVGARLERGEAISYRDLALVWSDRIKDENRAYQLDDWGALLWAGGPQFFEDAIAEWPALDRLSALSGALKKVQSAEQGRALLKRLETLAKAPEVVKADAARAEKQRYSESVRDRALESGRANFARALTTIAPAAALDEMEQVTNAYSIQGTAIEIASAAIASGQTDLAKRALRLGLKDNYTNSPGTAAMAMLARDFAPALADELLANVRAGALPKEEQRFGNQDWHSVANYAMALREIEPGAGRLLLEQEWTRRQAQKPDANDRWQRDSALRDLARTMAVYDVNRALEWAEKAGDQNYGGPNLRTAIVATALAAPAKRPFLMVRDYGG